MLNEKQKKQITDLKRQIGDCKGEADRISNTCEEDKATSSRLNSFALNCEIILFNLNHISEGKLDDIYALDEIDFTNWVSRDDHSYDGEFLRNLIDRYPGFLANYNGLIGGLQRQGELKRIKPKAEYVRLKREVEARKKNEEEAGKREIELKKNERAQRFDQRRIDEMQALRQDLCNLRDRVWVHMSMGNIPNVIAHKSYSGVYDSITETIGNIDKTLAWEIDAAEAAEVAEIPKVIEAGNAWSDIAKYNALIRQYNQIIRDLLPVVPAQITAPLIEFPSPTSDEQKPFTDPTSTATTIPATISSKKNATQALSDVDETATATTLPATISSEKNATQALSDVDETAKKKIKLELLSYRKHVRNSLSQQNKQDVIRLLGEIIDKLDEVKDKNDWVAFKDYFEERKERCFGHHDPVALSCLKTIMMWLSSVLVIPVIGYIASGNAGMYFYRPRGRSVSEKIENEIAVASNDTELKK